MDSRVYQSVLATFFILFATWTPSHGTLFQQMSTDRIKPVWKLESGQRRLVPGPVSLQSLSSLAKLGPRSGFRYAGTHIHKSPKGVKRVRLLQTHGGYDVFGSSVLAEMDLDEKFTGQMYGDVVRNLDRYISNPKACERSIDELHVKAIKSKRLSLKDPNIQKQDGQKVIFIDPQNNKARLAYKVQFYYNKGHRVFYPVYFFDACNGKVLTSYDQITTMMATESPGSLKPDPKYFRQSQERVHMNSSLKIRGAVDECSLVAGGYGGNPKIKKITYNVPPYCLNVWTILGWCRMRGVFTRVVDNLETTRRLKRNIVNFWCNQGYSDPVNEAYGVANDAFFNGELFNMFFRDRYNINVLYYRPRLVVHYDTQLENAFSDGISTFYGDGWQSFYPMVTLDIVAHELAHVVSTMNSHLIYRGMSGGISEAFSDITAIALRGYTEETDNPDWYIGASAMKASSGAIRYLDNPSKDGSSISSVFYYRPGMNVHHSSGIFNFAFYAMVKDQGMKLLQTYKSFLDANLNLWSPWTNFFTGACSVVQAAYDNGYDYRKVRNGFLASEIPLVFCRSSALTTTMYVGETRTDILVSTTRTPIFKVDIGDAVSNTTSVIVEASDNSDITLIVGRDDDIKRNLTSGVNQIVVKSSLSVIFVKLSSRNEDDVSVTMTVSG